MLQKVFCHDDSYWPYMWDSVGTWNGISHIDMWKCLSIDKPSACVQSKLKYQWAHRWSSQYKQTLKDLPTFFHQTQPLPHLSGLHTIKKKCISDGAVPGGWSYQTYFMAKYRLCFVLGPTFNNVTFAWEFVCTISTWKYMMRSRFNGKLKHVRPVSWKYTLNMLQFICHKMLNPLWGRTLYQFYSH